MWNFDSYTRGCTLVNSYTLVNTQHLTTANLPPANPSLCLRTHAEGDFDRNVSEPLTFET